MLIFMETRVSYPQKVKLKVVEMKLQGIRTKVILEELNILNDTQIETWTRWYKKVNCIVSINLWESNILLGKVHMFFQLSNSWR